MANTAFFLFNGLLLLLVSQKNSARQDNWRDLFHPPSLRQNAFALLLRDHSSWGCH